MYFLGIGLIALVLKYLEWEPMLALSWWWVLLPFALAVAWWSWADASGYTKRKAMERENRRMGERRERTKQALDANYKKPSKR